MIDWQDIKTDEEIHGLVDGEVKFVMLREKNPPFFWQMSGMIVDRSQYRNDLKERAEIHIKKQ